MGAPRSEFSRAIQATALDEGGTTMTVEADAGERARLAERFGLEALDSLTATLRLTPEKGGRLVRLEGVIKAEATQSCVVTLEPLKTAIDAAVERLYETAPDSQAARPAAPPDFEFDAEDPPEPAADGAIDVGEAIAEELALAIDPFPRKPGISFSGYAAGPGDSREPTASGGPFAILEAIKKKLK